MPSKNKDNQNLKITLVKGLARIKPQHRKTLMSLGLKKIGNVVERPNTPPVIGMIKQVGYLLKVE